jgi:peptidoglycan/LPS O-acetylase OafA/YrhL
VSIVLAANNFGDNSPAGQAGPLGLLVIVLLGIACWFLYRSLSKHLRRIPARRRTRMARWLSHPGSGWRSRNATIICNPTALRVSRHRSRRRVPA